MGCSLVASVDHTFDIYIYIYICFPGKWTGIRSRILLTIIFRFYENKNLKMVRSSVIICSDYKQLSISIICNLDK